METSTAQMWINIATPVVTPILTAGIKKLIPKIPAWLIPGIAVSLGTLANYLAQLSFGDPNNVLLTVGLALAGIGVRELTKWVNPITAPEALAEAKEKAVPVVAALMLLALPAGAATNTTDHYKAGEVSIESFYTTVTPDFEQEDGSVGVGANVFFTRNFGIGVSTSVGNMNGTFIDNVSLRGIYRVPIDRTAIYGYAGSTRLLKREEWTIDLGVGVEHRFTPHIGPFIEAGMVKLINHGANATGRVGLRYTW